MSVVPPQSWETMTLDDLKERLTLVSATFSKFIRLEADDHPVARIVRTIYSDLERIKKGRRDLIGVVRARLTALEEMTKI